MTRLTTVKIASLGKVVTGSTPPAAHPDWFAASGVPFVTPSDLIDGQRQVRTQRFLSEVGAQAMAKRLVPEGAVCFVSIGSTIGKMCSTTSPSVTNQQINSLVVDESVADPTYIYYAISQRSEHLKAIAGGSATPILNKTSFASVELEVLPLSEQRTIGAMLGAIDDKIESSRRLAERASALIDASASQLLARTSTEVLPLADLVEFNRLSVKPHSTDALRYIDIASVSSGQIDSVQELTWNEAPSRARRGVSDGDVIYSTVRPGNRAFALIVDPTPGSVASTGFAVMSPSVRLGSSMLTSVVGAPEFAEYLESVAHGSAYPAVGIQAMGNYSVVVPKEAVVAEQFEADTMPLRRRVAQARAESERLAALRDTLLPELLSGRMRVPVEGAAA